MVLTERFRDFVQSRQQKAVQEMSTGRARKIFQQYLVRTALNFICGRPLQAETK